jgi:hypothetical protein
MAKPNGKSTRNSSDNKNSAEIYSKIHSYLVGIGVKDATATSYATFAVRVYTTIQQDPRLQAALKEYHRAMYVKDAKEVGEGFKKALQANHLMQNAISMDSSSRVITGFRNIRATSAAGILNTFVEYFEKYAEHHGIKLDECSLGVTKVCLDVIVGGAAATTGWGLVLTGFCVIATFKDSYELGKACSAEL